MNNIKVLVMSLVSLESHSGDWQVYPTFAELKVFFSFIVIIYILLLNFIMQYGFVVDGCLEFSGIFVLWYVCLKI